MAIKRLQLTDSQHEGWSRFQDDKVVAASREKRFLAACLVELGGRLNEPWQFDEASETFWINIPDKEPNADSADAGTNRAGNESMAP